MVKSGEAATGAAWLSSARAVRRSLNWGNERNPYRQLQVFDETAQPRAREARSSGKLKVRKVHKVFYFITFNFINFELEHFVLCGLGGRRG